MKELKTAEEVLADKMLIAINEKAVITNRGTGDKYAAKECAKIAIAYAAQEKGWISVEERLPDFIDQNDIVETTCEVLIFDAVFGIATAWAKRYLKDSKDHLFPEYVKGYTLFENMQYKYRCVTHWQPLPPKP